MYCSFWNTDQGDAYDPPVIAFSGSICAFSGELPLIHLRAMTKADICAAQRLKKIAGWNQTEADWERFLEAGEAGCFVAELDGQVCGTATTISFESRFAWIGMVLVDPACRGRGIGTRLLEQTIAYLDARRIPCVKLDATPQGRPIYEKLGFLPEHEIERWTMRRPPVQGTELSGAGSPADFPPSLLQDIFETDRELFGADRSFLLKSLDQQAPDFTAGITAEGRLQGYTLGRRGSCADQLGPWMANDTSTARKLLERFLTRSIRDVLIVDCPKSNRVAGHLLQPFGFSYTRPLTRMYRGKNEHPGHIERLCAILGPEFG
jgi:GNAT superfamily N-acetyltransferase